MKQLAHFFTAFALIMLFASAAMAKIPPEGRQTLYKAQQHMDEKNYSQATKLIREYMETTSETIHEQIYITLGGAYHLAGNKKKSLATFRKGHQQHPKNEFLCLNTGILFYELEQFGNAGAYLEKAFSLQEKGSGDLLFQAGSAYYLGEKYSAAVKVLTRLLKLTPKPKSEWVRLTIHSMIEAKQTKQAERLLLTYLNLNPNQVAYWELLAKLYLDREAYKQAASALEVAYQIKDPDKAKLEQLAYLYRYLEAPLMAASTLQRAYGSTPSHKQVLKIAALTASAGRTEAAVNYLKRYGRTTPALLEQGKLLYQARQFEKAKAALTQCISQKAIPEARFYLALCAWEQRDWKTAHTLFSKLAGDKKLRQRAASSLAVIEDIETARREATQ